MIFRTRLKLYATSLPELFLALHARHFAKRSYSKTHQKYEEPPFQYPITRPLTKLRLFDSYAFYTTGIDHFGLLYAKLNSDPKSHSETPILVTLFTCKSSRGVSLDVIPRLDASSFIRSTSRRGCPTCIIPDSGRNFVSIETGVCQSIGH